MELELQLISDEICKVLKDKILDINIDAEKVLEIKSLNVLKSTQNILANDKLSDFDMIEEIVCLFEENGIYCGGCHDF